MSNGRQITIKGMKLKDGKLVKISTAKNVSQRIRERTSKRIKPVRRTDV